MKNKNYAEAEHLVGALAAFFRVLQSKLWRARVLREDDTQLDQQEAGKLVGRKDSDTITASSGVSSVLLQNDKTSLHTFGMLSPELRKCQYPPRRERKAKCSRLIKPHPLDNMIPYGTWIRV